MNKKIIFAALAALALTVGFTSCNKNDDDESVNNSFKETYTFHYELLGENTSDRDYIFTAYNKALGTAKGERNPEITITGKDSVDCRTKLLEKIAKANEEVDAIPVDDNSDNILYVYNANHYLVYMKHIGPATNAGVWKTPVMPFTREGKTTGKFVSSLKVLYGYGDMSSATDVYYPYSCNLNLGVGWPADNVRLMASCGDIFYIKDVVVLNTHSIKSAGPKGFNYNGCWYNRAYASTMEDYNSNVNSGIPFANCLYIYTTKSTPDKGTGYSLLQEGLAICYKYKDVPYWFDEYTTSTPADYDFSEYKKLGYEVKFAPMVRYDEKTDSYVLEDENANLNHTVSKNVPHIYLRCVYAP